MALKHRGIRGIGGFLLVSKQLRILWSKAYLSRLWCAPRPRISAIFFGVAFGIVARGVHKKNNCVEIHKSYRPCICNLIGCVVSRALESMETKENNILFTSLFLGLDHPK